jgi:hypothetical protein
MLYHKKITFSRILLWAVSVCITALPVILFAYTLLFHAEPIHFLGFTISPISGNRMDEISFSSLGANLWNNLKITLTYSIYPMDSVDKNSIPYTRFPSLLSCWECYVPFMTSEIPSGHAVFIPAQYICSISSAAPLWLL